MSRLSGVKGRLVEKRRIELLGKEYDAVVFGGWEGWKKYINVYLTAGELSGGVIPNLTPDNQWMWVQNYPDLIADDLSKIFAGKSHDTDSVRNIVYSDLLFRGVNKWLMVRYFIIRYKKVINNERSGSENAVRVGKKVYNGMLNNLVNLYNGNLPPYINNCIKNSYNYGYVKGYFDAMSRVRSVLKALSNSPRFVIWNKNKPGVMIDTHISDNYVDIVKSLYSVSFKK